MKPKRWVEGAVIVFVIALMALLWLPLLTSETKPWETGYPIPVEDPTEDRRIHNAAEFSIISPPDWTAKNHSGIIHLTPKQVFAGRSKAGIVVTLLQESPLGQASASDAEFLGQPAQRRVDRRPSTFDVRRSGVHDVDLCLRA